MYCCCYHIRFRLSTVIKNSVLVCCLLLLDVVVLLLVLVLLFLLLLCLDECACVQVSMILLVGVCISWCLQTYVSMILCVEFVCFVGVRISLRLCAFRFVCLWLAHACECTFASDVVLVLRLSATWSKVSPSWACSKACLSRPCHLLLSFTEELTSRRTTSVRSLARNYRGSAPGEKMQVFNFSDR